MDVNDNVISSPTPSQQTQVLKNVVAVFDESIDESMRKLLKEKLINCGASISNTWKAFGTGYSTHLIAKECSVISPLSKHVYNLGGYIVSPEWVTECEKGARVPEDDANKVTASSISETISDSNEYKSATPMDVTSDSLPSVFRSLVICIWPDVDKVKEIKRHIVAFDGDVVESITKNTTHIIAQNWASEFNTAIIDVPNILVVKPRWAYDSIKKKSRQRERPYYVQRT